MLSLVRDSAVGQVINYLSNGKVLPYKDQQPDFVVPTRFLTSEPSTSPRVEAGEVISPTPSSAVTAVEDVAGGILDSKVHGRDLEKAVGALKGNAEMGETPYPYLVEWEVDDEDNPR